MMVFASWVSTCSERLSALGPYAILNFERSAGGFSRENWKITFVPTVSVFTLVNFGVGSAFFSVTVRFETFDFVIA